MSKSICHISFILAAAAISLLASVSFAGSGGERQINVKALPDAPNTPPQAERAFPDYQEDFSALPLSMNHLKTEIEILGEKDDKPGTNFIRERWHLVWRPGDPIDVYVIRPRSVAKPPVVLYMYSYPQDTDRFKEDYWCGATTGNGIAAVGFVSALTGQRLEYRAPKDDFFNQLPESMGASVHDVQMVLNYLATRNDLDMTRVAMFGQGSGGAIAILASTVDPRIKDLDLLTPWGDWPVFLAKSSFVSPDERADVTKPEFLAKVAGLDPLQLFPKVKAQAVRLEDIRHDGHMPDDAQKRIEDAAPQIAEIDQYGDGSAFVPAAAGGILFNWLRSELLPEAGTQPSAPPQRIHYFPPIAPANPLDAKPEQSGVSPASTAPNP